MPSPRRAAPRRPALKASVIWAAVIVGSVASLRAPLAAAAAPRARTLQALSDCRRVAEPASRFACLEKAAEALDEAEAHGDVVVADRAQVHSVRRQAFGFNIPTLSFFGRGGREDSVDNVAVELRQASTSWQGKWTFVTADDAIWQQTDNSPMFKDPHRGSKMLIRKGALGGYFCKVDNQPAVRCARSQ